MRVEVRLFAMVRERAGAPTLELELEEGATVADAVAALRLQPALSGAGAGLPFRLAVNREYAPDTQPLVAGDELAVITPVSGGSQEADGARISARVSEEPISADPLTLLVGDPRAGAIVTFHGTTREVDLLRYEAYAEMAAERIDAILRECAGSHGLCAAAAAHRVGDVPLGEPSVIVAVSAPHRPEAFAGAREAIDRIKSEAPIWKKESNAGAEEWVEGSLP